MGTDMQEAYRLGQRDAYATLKDCAERGRLVSALPLLTPADAPKGISAHYLDLLAPTTGRRYLAAVYRRGYNEAIRFSRSTT